MYSDMRAVVLMDHLVKVHHEVKMYEYQKKNIDEKHNFYEFLVDKNGFVQSASSAWMPTVGITKDVADYLLRNQRKMLSQAL
jgi:hypothetical protein